jgi:hypothetical protein
MIFADALMWTISCITYCLNQTHVMLILEVSGVLMCPYERPTDWRTVSYIVIVIRI